MTRASARTSFHHRGVVAVLALSLLAFAPSRGDAGQAPTLQQRFDHARKVFDSEKQVESIPLFSELIDDLRALPNRQDGGTRLLIDSLLLRAQARLNFGQQAEATADVRHIQAISPTYRPMDRSISPVLVAMFTDVATSSGFVRIKTWPSGSRVTIDGSDVGGLTETPVPVARGRRTVAASNPCYEPATQVVDVAPGQTIEVHLMLRRLQDAACNQTPRRVMAAVNRGYHYIYETSDSAFGYFLYRENGDTRIDYGVAQGLDEIDFGAAVRVWGALGVGLNYSILDTTTTGLVDSRVPHPTFLNTPRTLAAEVPNLKRKEQALHLEIRGTHGSRRFEAAAFVGPSLFKLRQAIVTNVIFRDFTTSVAFLSAESREITEKSVIGFNIGADVAIMVIPYVGFGGFVRYSHARVEFSNDRDSGTLVAGGLQSGGGLRIRF